MYCDLMESQSFSLDFLTFQKIIILKSLIETRKVYKENTIINTSYTKS